jgi:hypothetical protein
MRFSIKGLHTANSSVSGVPEGSLSVAKNIDLSRINLAQSRRGFDTRYADLPDVSDRATRLFEFDSNLFAYYGTTLAYLDSGTWTSKGSLTKPTNALVPRFVTMNESLYTTSSSGLKKLDDISSSIYSAGIPSGLMMELAQSSTTGTAVLSGKTVAYRYVIGRYDANNYFSLGGVSGREVITATGADRNIAVKGFLPTTIDNTYIVQVYRSADSSTTSPDDELQLCYELPVYSQFFESYTKTFGTSDVDTGTETITSASHGFTDGMVVRFTTTGTLPGGLSAGTDYYIVGSTTNTFQVSTTFGGTAENLSSTGSGTHTVKGANCFAFNDITPEALLGATIYTAQSQQTLLNDNAEPPLASDMTEYKQFLFFADVESKHRFSFTLISVYDGSSSGEIRDGDTITISDGTTTEVYTADSSAADVSTKTFKVDEATSSVSQRIDNTIRSFISVVNQGSAIVYAYLATAGDDDLPGKCRIEARTLGQAAFSVVSTRQKAFNPQLTTTATTNQTSKSDAYRNGLMFSKQGQPEAVPLKNIFRVGSSDDPIKRIIGLRDALLIFKQRDGVYILRGENETSFSVSLLDGTAKIVAPESLVVLNGLVYGLFEAGVSTVSDTSVDVESDPIADKIQNLYGTCLDEVKAYTFAIGYETEGLYILSLPTADGDTYTRYQLVLNAYNGNWWEWDLEAGSGFVSTLDGKLYLGHGSKNRVMQEYKTFTYTDFTDYEQETTISSSTKDVAADETTLAVVAGIDEMSVGDIIYQTGVQPSYILSIDLSAGTVTVDLAQDWDTGVVVDHYKAIDCEIEWNPDFAGNPAGLKHYSACNILFAQNIIQSATMSFRSDVNPAVNSIPIDGADFAGAWGYMSWGSGTWGGESSPAPTRIGVPRESARCNNLTVKFSHRIAQSDWQLQGIALEFNPTSTRTSR